MSDLVGNPEDRFSRVEAHIYQFISKLKCRYMYGSDIEKVDEIEYRNSKVASQIEDVKNHSS